LEALEERSVPASLTAGFAETPFVSGLTQPTAMEFAPDGRLFITQKTGAVRVVQNGQLLAAPLLTVPVDSSSERGLNGIAFDPTFATNGRLYISYTTTNASAGKVVNRISRFVVTGNSAGGEAVLLDNIPSVAGNHNGGALHFGTDGMLYVGVGDSGDG